MTAPKIVVETRLLHNHPNYGDEVCFESVMTVPGVGEIGRLRTAVDYRWLGGMGSLPHLIASKVRNELQRIVEFR